MDPIGSMNPIPVRGSAEAAFSQPADRRPERLKEQRGLMVRWQDVELQSGGGAMGLSHLMYHEVTRHEITSGFDRSLNAVDRVTPHVRRTPSMRARSSAG